MARSLAAQLPKLLAVIEGDVVAGQVEHAVLERTSVSVTQDEAVAVRPLGTARRKRHVLRPEEVSHRSAAHRGAGVSRISSLDHVGAARRRVVVSGCGEWGEWGDDGDEM